MGRRALATATMALVLIASACGSPTATPVASTTTPAAAPSAPSSPPSEVGRPRSKYWTKARMAALRQAKDAYVPPPPPASGATAAVTVPVAPTEDSPSGAEVVVPAPTPTPAGTPEPPAAVEPAPAPAAPEKRPGAREPRTELSQRFKDALTAIDADLRDDRITLAQALRRLQRMRQWDGLSRAEGRLLKENVRRVRAIMRERARTRLGG